MNTATWIAIVALVWVASGLATALMMARAGHRDPAWLVMCLILGPMAIPIMVDRVEHVPRPIWSHVRTPESAAGLRIVVGLDGSPDADRALRSVVSAFAALPVTFSLVEVVGYDAADTDADGYLTRAEERLARYEAEFPAVASTRVIAGRPASVLAKVAADESADLIAVGRRGHGMSVRLLGSVAEAILHETGLPVLVGPRSKTTDGRGHRPNSLPLGKSGG